MTTSQRKNEIGIRIRELRKWLRISQTTVSEYLEIPRTAVSAFEASKREISANEIKSLSVLFRCDPNSLFGLTPTPVDEPKELTYLTRLNGDKSALDDHDIKELSSFSIALESQYKNFPQRIPAEKLAKSKSPQKAAEEFAHNIKCEAPIDIYSILIKVGLYPRFSALSSLAGAIVKSKSDGDKVYGVLINSDQIEERMRFSAAHELAHYVLGHLSENELVHTSPKARWRDAIESDADSFAAELLMPRSYLKEYFRSPKKQFNAVDAINLADDLLVSYQAILHRLLELGYLSRVDYESFGSEKPTELREVAKTGKQSKKIKGSKTFNTKELEPIFKMLNGNTSFIKSPDCIRWMQEAAYLKYCQLIPFNDRASDVKEVYEKVALWMAEEHPPL